MTSPNHHHRHEPTVTDRPPGLPRRTVLVGAGGLAAVALAGCLGGDDDERAPAEPIDLTGDWVCEVCGMVIEEHYGPAGQLFYADDSDDDPVAFDSVTELVVYHDGQGEDKRSAFVTDYSSVDYELITYDDGTHISTHAEADAFVDDHGGEGHSWEELSASA